MRKPPPEVPCASPFTPNPLPRAWRCPEQGLGCQGSDLAGSEDSEERVEEGGHQGGGSEGHGLGHPVHSGHDQHVSTCGLLEGEESGRLVTGQPLALSIHARPRAEAAGTWTQTRALGHGRGEAGPGGECGGNVGDPHAGV